MAKRQIRNSNMTASNPYRPFNTGGEQLVATRRHGSLLYKLKIIGQFLLIANFILQFHALYGSSLWPEERLWVNGIRYSEPSYNYNVSSAYITSAEDSVVSSAVIPSSVTLYADRSYDGKPYDAYECVVRNFSFIGKSNLQSIDATLGENGGGYANVSYCASLQSVCINGGGATFNCDNCPELKSVSLNSSIWSVSIKNCGALSNISLPNSVSHVSMSGCSSLQSISIPDSVTGIGFSGCSSLQSISIPSGVTSIEYQAFFGCSSLQSVSMPNVTSIGGSAFYGCSSLQSISIPSGVTSIVYQTFYGCSSLQSVSMPNVTSIGNQAFYGCSSLQSVSMPNVTSIGYNAFSDCSSLQSIAIPSGVTSIESATFSMCTSLESVTIGDSVGSIGSKAFYQCSSLAEVTIPASVTNIALDAFKSCDGLQRFIVDSANPVYASYDGALYTKDLKTLIIYPGGRTDVKLPSGALAAKEDAFTGCEKLWAEWYRTFQKTRYDLTNGMEDRAIASVTVNADTYLGSFVLKEGKVYDSVIYINNVSGSQVKVSLPEGNIYKTFKGAAPLTLPGHSTSILTVTRVAGGAGDNVFLVTREELEDVK